MEMLTKQITDLLKTMEAGNYDAKPSNLVQGAALQREDLSPKMENVCFADQSIVLQKMIDVKPAKANTHQFVRQLSYGEFGGSAQMEGHVGPENTSEFARVTVPMGYYVDQRRVTEVSMLVDTFDGKKSDERAAEDSAMKIAGDVEFALFRGADDFVNGGVFDGNPDAIARILPGTHGAFLQIRQSDAQRITQDQMFAEFGSADSVVFSQGGTLTQSLIEDMRTRTVMNHGTADKLVIDPIVHGAYNKITQGKERVILAGAPQEATGSRLNRQWTANGDVDIVGSRFLSGKTNAARPRTSSPATPATFTATSTTTSGLVTPFKAGQKYWYGVTAVNENGGESPMTFISGVLTIAADGDEVVLAIGAPASGVYRQFNVYRSLNGGSKASTKYIGRVAAAASGSTTFNDQGNKLPASVTGALIQADTWEIRELAPFTRKRLAETDLTHPEVFYRFVAQVGRSPRKNSLADNLSG